MKETKQRFKELREGNIVGIVTSLGEVRSEFTGEEIEHHLSHWNSNGSAAWRWDFNQAIWWTIPTDRPTDEELELIQRHLTRKYGIKFLDSGHFDWEHMLIKSGMKQGSDGQWK